MSDQAAGTRKLVTYHILSLDGVASSPERWVFDHFDAELSDHLGALVASQDAVLLGRVTYEAWASFWPTSTNEPFASFINGSPKHVASTTLDEVTWTNASLIEGDLAAHVEALKAQPGKDIGVHGSIALTRSLLRAGYVDELRLAVLPVVVGDGERLFDGVGGPQRLELVRSQQTTSGGLLLTYRPRTL